MVRRVARPLVCIPTYNEASNILALVEQVHAAAPEVDVLVIDDASPDGTGDLVRTQILKDARLEIMARPAKLGLGTPFLARFPFRTAARFPARPTHGFHFPQPPGPNPGTDPG